MHSSYFENWYKKLSIKGTLLVFENDMSFEVLSRVTQGLNQSAHDSSSEPRISWSFVHFHPQLTCIQRNTHGVYTLLVFRWQGSLGSVTVTSLSPGFLGHFSPRSLFHISLFFFASWLLVILFLRYENKPPQFPFGSKQDKNQQIAIKIKHQSNGVWGDEKEEVVIPEAWS